MALKPVDRANFETLQREMAAGHCALVESRCAKTGEYRALICATNYDSGSGEVLMTPLAQMVTGNPYEDYVDPTSEKLPKAKR